MKRRGFSILEAVVAAAILALLGAAVVPSVVAYKREIDMETTVSQLVEIRFAVNKFKLPANVGFYPGRLSDLSTEYVTTTGTTSCGTTYASAGATVAKWRVGGPYIARIIPTTGLDLGIGIANNLLERSSGATTVGNLLLRIPEVPLEDALLLNDLYDGPGDPETGTMQNLDGGIRWPLAPAASGTVSLIFVMPISKTC